MAILGGLVFAAILVSYGLLYRRLRRRKVGIGAVGTVYDMLHEDHRKAIEIVVSEKAGATEPENADGTPH
jgi:hypothetical protein